MENSKKKHSIKFIFKIIIIILIQIFFAFFSFKVISGAYKPTSEMTFGKKTVVVSDVRSSSYPFKSPCVIYTETEKYYFNSMAICDEYGSGKLREVIQVGDVIDITYDTVSTMWGEVKWIEEARSGNELYASIQVLDSERQSNRIGSVIFCCCFELLFLAIVVLYIVLSIDKKRKAKENCDSPVFSKYTDY